MPWKKDLAKLKQELVKEDPSPAKAPPPPKIVPKTPVSQSIEEEDTIFLRAMGLRPQAQVRATPAPVAQPAPPPLVRAEPPAAATGALGEFSSAMGDLKGMKPLARNPVEHKPEPPKAEPPVVAAPPPVPEPKAVPPPAAPAAPLPKPEAPAGPVEIHLAAGMAIEVDGSLDLRGHGRIDGEERLKERILDGYALGWRTLHVNVGSPPELAAMVLALLHSPEGRCVARYAQAPVPMGGAQAWILYFRPLPASAGETP